MKCLECLRKKSMQRGLCKWMLVVHVYDSTVYKIWITTDIISVYIYIYCGHQTKTIVWKIRLTKKFKMGPFNHVKGKWLESVSTSRIQHTEAKPKDAHNKWAVTRITMPPMHLMQYVVRNKSLISESTTRWNKSVDLDRPCSFLLFISSLFFEL